LEKTRCLARFDAGWSCGTAWSGGCWWRLGLLLGVQAFTVVLARNSVNPLDEAVNVRLGRILQTTSFRKWRWRN